MGSTFNLVNSLSGNQTDAAEAAEMLAMEILIHAKVPGFPRFREAYFAWNDDKTAPLIRVRTRSGGGNRDDYEAENGAIDRHQLCIGDEDDDCDGTYAIFTFTVPENCRELALCALRDVGETPSFGQRLAATLDTIRASKP